jgi:hypothetical protein
MKTYDSLFGTEQSLTSGVEYQANDLLQRGTTSGQVRDDVDGTL